MFGRSSNRTHLRTCEFLCIDFVTGAGSWDEVSTRLNLQKKVSVLGKMIRVLVGIAHSCG